MTDLPIFKEDFSDIFWIWQRRTVSKPGDRDIQLPLRIYEIKKKAKSELDLNPVMDSELQLQGIKNETS